MEFCRLCAAPLDAATLELGSLPPCNRFGRNGEAPPVHRLAMIACEACGFVQLADPMPVAMVTPRASWIAYNEPAAHIADLCGTIVAALGHVPESALGIGPFEGPLLDALARRGAAVVRAEPPFQPENGLFPYLESWQAALCAGAFAPCRAPDRRPDIVSCRYLLEHCHDPLAALRGLARAVRPGGLVVVEVPDSAKFLKAKDYCFPWEEHVGYFTEATFEAMCRRAGLAPTALVRYPGDLEDALVAVLRTGAAAEPTGAAAEPTVGAASDLFSAYRAGFQARCDLARRTLVDVGGLERVALFGAGHHAMMFANALRLAGSIAYVVDDDQNKVGTIPPGFSSPVRSSSDLLADPRIALCLLAVSPRSDAKVRAGLGSFTARGGDIRSIYVMGPHSIFAGADR